MEMVKTKLFVLLCDVSADKCYAGIFCGQHNYEYTNSLNFFV